MTAGSPLGKDQIARALWYAEKGVVALRSEPLPPLGPRDVRVRTRFSAVSRGSERLVLNGLVPPAEARRMRAPLQQGEFPFPVKYGYAAVGTVEDGPPGWPGRAVFCLHPHQDLFHAPVAMAVPLPDGLPLRRATLGANMETALNALWDSGAAPADRIVVVGAGIVGLLVAYLSARLPGATVTVIDPAPGRREIIERLGARHASTDADRASAEGADVVFHTSATSAGVATALAVAGAEATVIELSWYGANAPTVPLGGAFHSQRLRLIASQVGTLALSHRARWTHARRLQAALGLLHDPVLDTLLDREIAFEDAPGRLPELLTSDAPGLAPVIRYPA